MNKIFSSDHQIGGQVGSENSGSGGENLPHQMEIGKKSKSAQISSILLNMIKLDDINDFMQFEPKLTSSWRGENLHGFFLEQYHFRRKTLTQHKNSADLSKNLKSDKL